MPLCSIHIHQESNVDLVHIKMNTKVRSVGMTLLAVVVIVAAVVVAVSAMLEIRIINMSHAQVRQSATNTTISPALKSKICYPGNPKLAFVNTTESNICGLPKSIKNVTTTTSTPKPTPKPIAPS